MSRRKLGSSLETNKLSPEEEALVAAARPKAESDSVVEPPASESPSSSAEENEPETENSEAPNANEEVAPSEDAESQDSVESTAEEPEGVVEVDIAGQDEPEQEDEKSGVDIEFLENTRKIEEKPKKRKRKTSRKPETEESEAPVEATAIASNPEVVLITDSFKLKREIRDRLLRASFERKLTRAAPYTKQAIVNDALESWLSDNGF